MKQSLAETWSQDGSLPTIPCRPPAHELRDEAEARTFFSKLVTDGPKIHQSLSTTGACPTGHGSRTTDPHPRLAPPSSGFEATYPGLATVDSSDCGISDDYRSTFVTVVKQCDHVRARHARIVYTALHQAAHGVWLFLGAVLFIDSVGGLFSERRPISGRPSDSMTNAAFYPPMYVCMLLAPYRLERVLLYVVGRRWLHRDQGRLRQVSGEAVAFREAEDWIGLKALGAGDWLPRFDSDLEATLKKAARREKRKDYVCRLGKIAMVEIIMLVLLETVRSFLTGKEALLRGYIGSPIGDPVISIVVTTGLAVVVWLPLLLAWCGYEWNCSQGLRKARSM